MKNDDKDFGPVWQIEQQIKHYDTLAVTYGNEALRATAKAQDARNMAERYREAQSCLNSKHS